MPLICYDPKPLNAEKLNIIAMANKVIGEYQQKGFSLTLRQLYYVFVANDMFPDGWTYTQKNGKFINHPDGTKNAPPNYNRLGDIISDGRMAGLIDWNAIVDRSRSSHANQHWARPSQILESTVSSYHIDKWAEQPNYVEVWVEKEALQDVLSQACRPLDVRFFACKGYTSQSAMWEASQRLVRKVADGKRVHVIHLGDHDPSGVDMTRDVFERLETFVGHNDGGAVEVHRIALNMDQIEEYNPPPNPAKTTDSRAKDYIAKYGHESWELDALRPEILVNMIQKKVLSFRDEVIWEKALQTEQRGKHTLECICTYFPDVVSFLRQRRKVDNSRILCASCGATEANPNCQCADGGVKGVIAG